MTETNHSNWLRYSPNHSPYSLPPLSLSLTLQAPVPLPSVSAHSPSSQRTFRCVLSLSFETAHCSSGILQTRHYDSPKQAQCPPWVGLQDWVQLIVAEAKSEGHKYSEMESNSPWCEEKERSKQKEASSASQDRSFLCYRYSDDRWVWWSAGNMRKIYEASDLRIL